MKTTLQVFTALSVLALSACGKVTAQVGNTRISFNTGEASAQADVASCPSDMTLIPASPGYGAYCIETAVRTSAPPSAALVTCGSAGRSVCSFSELTAAGDAVAAVPIHNQVYAFGYWTRDAAGNQSGQFYAAQNTAMVDPTDLASPNQPFYCCSR